MDEMHHFEECFICKRKILVSIVLFGVSHNAGVSVHCKECLKKEGVDEKYKKQNPKGAKEIEEWLEDE